MNITRLLMDGEEDPRTARKIDGVVPALVTNNRDPDKLGRVKLRFPWLSDHNESDWARVASLMAGQNRGAVFLPEVGDEVLVAFEHGDINYPYVLGALWSASDRPPEVNDNGRNDLRVIRSRSGHTVEFGDQRNGREHITIKSNGGHSIVLNDTSGEKKIEIRTDSGHTIVLDDVAGSLVVKDRSGNEIRCRGRIMRISGAGSIAINARRISLRGSQIDIEAGSALTLRGGVVRIN
jgi:uncharacterized protein involved in type VI secretion and phage assembly